VSRLFGASPGSPYADSQNARIEKLLVKAGYSFIYPAGLDNLCCGMAFASKGFPQEAEKKMEQLAEALVAVSANGKYPILVDTSPCAQRLKACSALHPSLRVYDISDFLMDFVVPRVRLRKRPGSIAVHVPCSIQKTGQESLITLARLCVENVCTPDSTPCCGFAGDKGFINPELSASALVTLKTDLPQDCELGFSSSRTCEIGLSLHSGISYQSIAYLVDEGILEGASRRS
jgi:D-lactate dehydrogenase